MCASRPRARGTQGDRELRAILSQPPGLCVLHFLTLLLHERAIPSFFLTLMIKPLLPHTRRREMQGSFLSVTLHSRTALWASQGINYCTALLWQGWVLLSLSLLLFSFLFHFPAPWTFLFLPPAQSTLTICPSPNISYPSLKERSLPNF